MKTIVRSILFAAVFAAIPLAAQAPDAQDQQLLTLVKELAAKQSQMADNESKIDTKVADLAEALRVARIFMSRAGGSRTPPKK